MSNQDARLLSEESLELLRKQGSPQKTDRKVLQGLPRLSSKGRP